MIPRSDITAWRSNAPWKTNEQVEQDLIIARALIELFSDDLIRNNLAFRGGTALHKLYLVPQARYSEDIDLVQLKPMPIGEVFDRVKSKLHYLGKPKIKQHNKNNTLIFRFESEIPPIVQLKLKIEINCREHFVVYDLEKHPFNIQTKWFTGACELTTFCLEELLGSKIRALYQRKKGRDLFDLWYSLKQRNPDIYKTIRAFKTFMEKEQHTVSSREFEINLIEKLKDAYFLGDIQGLIRPGIEYNAKDAYNLVFEKIVSRL